MPGITNLSDLVERYFSSKIWFIVFIVSIIYLFLRAKASGKRAIIAASVFFFLCINEIVIRWFTDLGENGSFYRHLWAIPSMAIIGIAVIDLIRIIPKWILRLPVIALMIIGLWFINCQEYIRCRTQAFSADAKMVEAEVIELSEGFEKLKKETGKEKLFVVCPIGYEKNYGSMPSELYLYSGILKIADSSILSNSLHNGETELTGGTPDISYIMSTCCANGMDYVILLRNDTNEELFSENGYNPVFTTETYLVYNCYGFKGFRQDENRWGQISSKAYFTESGKPDVQKEGYCSVRYEYDGKGNKEKELYYGSDGKLCITSSGYSGIKYEYNSFHKWTKKTYLGLDEEPTTLASGISSTIRTFTKGTLRESQKHVDIDNNPVLVSGCFETRYTYNEKGQLIKESYYDENGQPMMRTDALYASKVTVYNDDGKAIGERYYDTEGKLTYCLAKHTGYIRELDDKGRICRETYLDENDSPVIGKLGYASLVREYNDIEQTIRETYEDENGNNVLLSKGYASLTQEYDSSGNVIKETYFDIDGNLVTIP